MLSLPAGRQGLMLSGAFYPDLKIGVWRRRTYQKTKMKITAKIPQDDDSI